VSTRRRIVRTSIAVLIVLAIGSIGSACFLGASTIGPKKAFAEKPVSETGTLGVGERTIAPLTESVTATDKVPVERSTSATAAAALSVPAVKRVTTTAQYRRATQRATPARAVKRLAAVTIGGGFLRGWQRARCSWYGPGFYGHTMAGGGKLKRNSMVVAHKRLPFGTRIQFWHRGRTVTAVVRDRGPFISGRSFDLGPGTAKALGFAGVGVVRYRILGRSRS